MLEGEYTHCVHSKSPTKFVTAMDGTHFILILWFKKKKKALSFPKKCNSSLFEIPLEPMKTETIFSRVLGLR